MSIAVSILPLMKESEDPLDIFYFYFGILRNTIKKVSPETWKNLLKKK